MATRGGTSVLSDEDFDVECTLGKRKNRVKQAKKYCIELKNLSKDGVEINNERIGEHTLVDGYENDSEVNLLTEKCERHQDRLIELFCVGHDQLVCSICALHEHRQCGKLESITDSMEDVIKVEKVHEVPEQLKTTLQNVDEAIHALEKHVEELSQREHKFFKEIEEYAQRLLVKIETLRQNARHTVTSKHKQVASEAKEKRTVCVTAKSDLTKCMDDMTSAGNRKAHLFILKKKGQSMTKNVETLCRESENMMKRVEFMLRPDWRIEDTMNEFISLVTDREKYKMSSKVNIDASVEDDSQPCYILGCHILADGTVLLADYNNDRVKQVDPTECTIKDHCDLKDAPRGITCIGPHEVAVGTGSTSAPVISIGKKMTCPSTIQLNNNCLRITNSNEELFTTDVDCVYVHDLTGTLLRTICKNTFGENMFSRIKGIVLSQTGDRVYVADWDKGLICTDRAGREVFRRSKEELGIFGAGGLCIDQRGNVLMCGGKSNNVVQVTEEGRVIGEILSKTDGIVKPRCLCYDLDKRRLYVGGETSELMMYQLM